MKAPTKSSSHVSLNCCVFLVRIIENIYNEVISPLYLTRWPINNANDDKSTRNVTWHNPGDILKYNYMQAYCLLITIVKLLSQHFNVNLNTSASIILIISRNCCYRGVEHRYNNNTYDHIERSTGQIMVNHIGLATLFQIDQTTFMCRQLTN